MTAPLRVAVRRASTRAAAARSPLYPTRAFGGGAGSAGSGSRSGAIGCVRMARSGNGGGGCGGAGRRRIVAPAGTETTRTIADRQSRRAAVAGYGRQQREHSFGSGSRPSQTATEATDACVTNRFVRNSRCAAATTTTTSTASMLPTMANKRYMATTTTPPSSSPPPSEAVGKNGSGDDDNHADNNRYPGGMDMAYAAVGPFRTNQYAVACRATGRAALVDCGFASPRELAAFARWLDANGYALSAVWLTHAHLDHVAGLGLVESYLRQQKQQEMVPVYLHEYERGIYNTFEQRRREYGFVIQPFDGGSSDAQYKLPDDSTLRYFHHDTLPEISVGRLTFRIFHSPGHSPGHVGYYYHSQYRNQQQQQQNQPSNRQVGDGDDRNKEDEDDARATVSPSPSSSSSGDDPVVQRYFGGDFIMEGSIGRTDFPTSDPRAMYDSLRRFVAEMDDELILYPGHGLSTSLLQEKQYNPYLREFVPQHETKLRR